MANSMIKELKKWHLNPEKAPRTCIIKGEGGKAFCAGGDIKAVYNAREGKEDRSIMQKFFAREYLLDYSLSQMHPV